MVLSNQPFSGRRVRESIINLGILCVLDKSGILLSAIENFMKNYESKQVLINIEALNKGIVPSTHTDEINQYFDSVSYDEKIRLKRKFRKLQRKYRKERKHIKAHNIENDDHYYGEKNKQPNRFQKTARKTLVFNAIAKELDA